MENNNQNTYSGQSSEKDEAEFQRQSMEREKANPHTTENDMTGGLSSGKTPEDNRDENRDKNRDEYKQNRESKNLRESEGDSAYKPDSYDNAVGLEKQREYNDSLENQSDTQLNDSASRIPSKDVETDTGYKQKETEEMGGEVERKKREENLEKGRDEGGAKDSHGMSVNEAENFGDENTITENTKERATLDYTGRSVI
jgi:hypothetical protein